MSGTPLVTYIDPDAGFAVGYPPDWRLLSDEEIQAELGILDESTLANVGFVAVDPSGLANVSLITVPGAAEGATLDDVAARLLATLRSSVSGFTEPSTERIELDGIVIGFFTEPSTERIELDGVDAMRLSYMAHDPVSGDRRVVRQIIAIIETDAIVLSFVTDESETLVFDLVFRRIEASWRWAQAKSVS